MLGALGTLYARGHATAWTSLYPDEQLLVRLPTYQWQRERYWMESEDSRRARLGEQNHPLLGRRVSAPQPTWQLELNTRRLPYLLDHQIQGAALVPGAAYVEMALAAASEVYGKRSYILENIEFRSALFVPETEEPTVRMTLDPRLAAFEVYSQTKGTEGPWTLHASVQLQHG
jgi:acyl transferase domain-containing protein